MQKYQKPYIIFLTLCVLALEVQSLNYFSPGTRSRFQAIPQNSDQTPVIAPQTVQNLTADLKPRARGTPYTIFYPLNFPQSRGGKNLNLTLVTESPPDEQVKSRVMNQPFSYFSNPQTPSTKDSHNDPYSPLNKYNDNKGTPFTSKDIPTSPKSINFNPPSENFSDEEVDYGFPPETPKNPEVSNKDFRQPKTVRYSPPQRNQPPDVPISPPKQQKFDKNTVSRYNPPPQRNQPPDVPISPPKQQKFEKNTVSRYNPPPQLNQKVTGDGYATSPLMQGINQNWPCFCVPYYLCKNGFINSGGRSVAALARQKRTAKYTVRNKTYPPPSAQPKVMNRYVVQQVSDSSQCEGNKVCCQMSFADDDTSDNQYPVATPPPEPYYPIPPRFPEKRKPPSICGIRRAYGIQGRLEQLQYSADVSEFAEYPWQVAVLRKIEGQKSLYLCGGVLISFQWVATAAHCVKKEAFSPLLIRLGEWDVNRKDEVYPYIEVDVDSVVLHPDFNADTLYNDIALIHMTRPVDPNLPHIAPACLPKRGTVYENEKCWISGWGKDFFGPQGEYQNVLKEVDVPVISRSTCNAKLRSTNLGSDFTLHPGFLCAGGEAGKDACTGDGGSPLVCRSGSAYFVVGLVSWGIGCGQPGVPGIYVNVLYYIDWINSVTWR